MNDIESAFFAVGIVLLPVAAVFFVWPRGRFRAAAVATAIAAGTCLLVWFVIQVVHRLS